MLLKLNIGAHFLHKILKKHKRDQFHGTTEMSWESDVLKPQEPFGNLWKNSDVEVLGNTNE
jgi:hypothetical protein